MPSRVIHAAMTITSLMVANTMMTTTKLRKGMEKAKNLLSNTSEWAALLRNSSKPGRIAPVHYALEKTLS